MKVRVSVTFFLGELNPATLSLRSRYSSTFDMKSSALSQFPVKRGGFAPIALTFAAAATGCRGCAAAGCPPPPPPLPPPPPSQTAMWSSVWSLAAERGCVELKDMVDWVVACIWVVVVITILDSWVSVVTHGLLAADSTAGVFQIVLFIDAVLLDAVLVESLSDSKS